MDRGWYHKIASPFGRGRRKIKAYIESHQPRLGQEDRDYIKSFRAAGEPIMLSNWN